MKLFTVILAGSLLLGACATQAPVLDGRSQQHFYQSLAEQAEYLDEEKFERLVWAVGYLQIHQLQPFTLDDFYTTLDGLDAAAVIARAEALQRQQMP
ncbi:MAG: hypothetical protein Tsb002_13080 [Wenzhouxiangellaceae bacterium]